MDVSSERIKVEFERLNLLLKATVHRVESEYTEVCLKAQDFPPSSSGD
jgi:hypothetical protein